MRSEVCIEYSTLYNIPAGCKFSTKDGFGEQVMGNSQYVLLVERDEHHLAGLYSTTKSCVHTVHMEEVWVILDGFRAGHGVEAAPVLMRESS